MAEKTCPHGMPATSFCKRCDRGEPAPQQASVARMSLAGAAEPPPSPLAGALSSRKSKRSRSKTKSKR